MIAALIITVIQFLTDCRMNIKAEEAIVRAPGTPISFVARDTPVDLQGFAVWRQLTPLVRDYLLMPGSTYYGDHGTYLVTFQHIDHGHLPNVGSDITVTGGGTMLLLHGTVLVNGVKYEVNQWNYRYFPPLYIDLP